MNLIFWCFSIEINESIDECKYETTTTTYKNMMIRINYFIYLIDERKKDEISERSLHLQHWCHVIIWKSDIQHTCQYIKLMICYRKLPHSFHYFLQIDWMHHHNWFWLIQRKNKISIPMLMWWGLFQTNKTKNEDNFVDFKFEIILIQKKHHLSKCYCSHHLHHNHVLC